MGKRTLCRPFLISGGELHKLDSMGTMLSSFREDFSGLHSRVGGISSSIGSIKSDLPKFNEKCEELSERVSKVEIGVSSLEMKWVQYQTDISKSMSVVQESVDTNSKGILEGQHFSQQLSTIQENFANNSKKLLELQPKSDKLQSKWEAIDAVESRVKSVAEDKFSLLKSALKEDLIEILTVKVKAIQNNASNSISQGIDKLKSGFTRT